MSTLATASSTTASSTAASSTRTTVKNASLAGAIRAEWIKSSALKGTWIRLAIAAALSGLVAMLASNTIVANPEAAVLAVSESGSAAGFTIAMAATWMGLIVISMLAGSIATHEYAHGSIRTTLIAQPRRGIVLAAKMAVTAAYALLGGVLCLATAYGAAWANLSQVGALPDLADGQTLRLAGGLLLALVSLCWLALALGHLVRSTVVSNIVIVAVLFVIPSTTGMVQSDIVEVINKVLPQGATAAIGQALPAADPTLLSPWLGLVAVLAWGILPSIAAHARMRTADL
ncbi:ABC transporter permease [Demequina pelophila]|uniref:ABC transporter permease n=1 Tax=Demequina pelophila TaxID=1638984 RepID=UPI000782882F|nr:ABC transporter permease [Demequina pelophila]